MDLAAEWAVLLRTEADGYARAALANIRREFPSAVEHVMSRPGDFPHRPRARTPVFYGSYDWHSSVGMHWLLVRLLRVAGDAAPAREIRTALNAQFSYVALASEADYVAAQPGAGQCPHGWGWLLALAHEIGTWDDTDARKWASAIAPLTETATRRFLDWLPGESLPVRHGTWHNSAFALWLTLGHARWRAEAGEPALLTVITDKAHAWFAGDTMYPGDWEPSGEDVLSPALTEAALMAQLLPDDAFAEWLGMFLPGIAGGQPAGLFAPIALPGAGETPLAWPHGLNANRAWAWRRISESLPPSDPRAGRAAAAARDHAAAALPFVLAEDYAISHWLPCHATLMLG